MSAKIKPDTIVTPFQYLRYCAARREALAKRRAELHANIALATVMLALSVIIVIAGVSP